MTDRRILIEADDVTPDILAHVEDCLGFFEGERGLNTEEFIDRLCNTYGGDDFDIENYDNPAVRKIMRHARETRKER